MVLAGEASGDEHAARVIMALKARWPQSRFVGIGGERMKEQGVELFAELDVLAVMGVAEVIPRLPFLFRLKRRLISLLDSGAVDLVIPVDYAGFNLRIARAARRRALPVLYYIAPKIWAWRADFPVRSGDSCTVRSARHVRRTSASGDARAGA